MLLDLGGQRHLFRRAAARQALHAVADARELAGAVFITAGRVA